ncbi:class I SAM-dependent methyltransferase, partial [Peptostreptococcaceae bacterium OttesenSCG-928-C18]|nr:class I SAM-dependent methyltransferase [Peptostreptococcaceae bacterium OttesenSCG-928-C18]
MNPKNILEIGIGTGNLTKKLDYDYEEYYGVDLSNEMLEIASNNLSNMRN